MFNFRKLKMVKWKLPRWAPSWQQFTLMVLPIICSPLATYDKEGRCAYVILIMAVCWMLELLPIPVTALIPVFAFPLLGVLSTKEVTPLYMKETIMMFLGGLSVAVAVEHCNLHKRIALFIILHVGQSTRRLMTGIMLTTMFLSMWISNTASTAMMVPIVDALLQQLYIARRESTPQQPPSEDLSVAPRNSSQVCIAESSDDLGMVECGQVNPAFSDKDCEIDSKKSKQSLSEEETDSEPEMFSPPPNEECRNLKDMFYLATAYSANLGGTGVITGTGPNLVVKGVLDESYGENNPINFATWMAFNIPNMLLCAVLSWGWLQIFFMGCKGINIFAGEPKADNSVKEVLEKKYKKLGSISFHEAVVLCLFILLVLLWLFRSPGFVIGWGDRFSKIFPSIGIYDATPAIFITFLLFVIPKKPKLLAMILDSHSSDEKNTGPCLTWDILESKIPWGVVLLLGGGFAMAEAAEKSNLSNSISQQLRSLNVLSKELIVLVVCLLTAMVTECASNTATASILMPVLKELSLGIQVHPVYLMLPATLCCSYAFMLPVATAPNAIVVGASGMKILTMMKAGIVMNIICVAATMFSISTFGVAMFDLNTFPVWANVTIEEV